MSEMMCEGGCMFGLPLINDKQRARMIHRLKLVEEGRLRDRAYINELQKIRRPKVSGVQIDRYFGMLILGGIDMDRDPMTDHQKRRHEKLATMTREKWKRKKEKRKKHFAQNPPKKKKVASKIPENKFPKVKKHMKDVTLSVNNNTRGGKITYIKGSHLEYLQNQTPEQFNLARKFGPVIAKLLTDPEPNFHLPEPQGMAAQGIDKQDCEQDEK